MKAGNIKPTIVFEKLYSRRVDSRFYVVIARHAKVNARHING